MKKVAFICVHNSCRSQIAEALCRRFRKDLIPYSAGTQVMEKINPDAVRIMNEIYKIDMSKQYSKLIEDIPDCEIKVSMGCNVVCPNIKNGFQYNFNIKDPSGMNDESYIKVIEEIKTKILNMKVEE